MSSHEKKWIQTLLSKETPTLSHKKTLAKIPDYMEESYILNLPPSPILIEGLKAYTRQQTLQTSDKNAAKRLLKTYGLRD